MIAIEKDIPLPQSRNGKFPHAKMEVGDSFLVPGGVQQAVGSYARAFGRRNNKTFATRKVADGVRVWRIA